ncbi:hypothetical protein ODI84_13400 [Pseudomonas putida]|uniref:hypothetical protein n=1 Tax=Pseudomonas putida TaxID=303 RepID=UPI002D1F0509|nr:hypothetical protein [Pseudomonas putida]MEB3901160.1 hypothetical protein [Pseudomonas putida]
MAVEVLENFQLTVGVVVQCDAFIYFSSSESRSRHFASEYSIERKTEFVLLLSDADDTTQILSEIEKFRAYLDSQCQDVRVVLDISCMPREIMAEMLAIIHAVKKIEIELVAVYSLAKFSSPSEEIIINEEIEPVHKRFAGWSSPDTKPTSLILGLGYEPDRAEGASEFFEPSDQWVFVPKSPVLEFFEVVASNNKDLLSEVGKRHVIEYNVLDPSLTFAQLEMVIGLLVEKTNPILLPFGPKIFFFLCLVQCLHHPQLGVWHFSNKNNLKALQDIYPSGEVVGVRCVFS